MHHGHLRSRPQLIPSCSKLDIPTFKPGYMPSHHHSNPRCLRSSLDVCSILSLSISCPSCPRAFQTQPEGCFEDKCHIMPLLCSELPTGSKCHSGSSTYTLSDVNSPPPFLASSVLIPTLPVPRCTPHFHCAPDSEFSFLIIIFLISMQKCFGLIMAFAYVSACFPHP